MEEIDNKHSVKIILIILKEITTAYEQITEFGTKFTQLLVYNSAKRDFYITVALITSTKDYGTSTFPSADLVFPDKFMKNVVSAVRSKIFAFISGSFEILRVLALKKMQAKNFALHLPDGSRNLTCLP